MHTFAARQIAAVAVAAACLLYAASLRLSAAQSAADAATVTGTVVAPDGRPVAGVAVDLFLMNAGDGTVAGSGHALSTADGSYTVNATAPGQHLTIEIVKASTKSAIGFKTAGFDNNVRVILRPRGDFRVHLHNASERGAAVQGVKIEITSMICSTQSRQSGDIISRDDVIVSPGIAPEYTATTDFAGDATIHGLPQGVPVALATVASPYVLHGSPSDRAFGVAGLAGSTNHIIDVLRLGSISGRIVFAGSGKPAAGVCVKAFQGSLAVEPTVYTDDAGRYEIDGLTPDNYTICPFDRDDQIDFDDPVPAPWAAKGRQVDVGTGKPCVGVDFTLERGGLVYGTMTDSASGAPAAYQFVGARISGSPLITQMTDQAGKYAIRLPAGPAILVPVASQFDIDDGERDRIAIADGGLAAANLSVNPRGDFRDVEGVVLQSNGRPAPGARVVALGQYGGSVQADASGHFVFSDIPPESKLYATTGNELTPKAVYAFDDGDPNRVTLRMRPGFLSKLTGRVLTRDGKPIHGAAVTIGRLAGNSETIYAEVTTDAQGRYTSPGLWSGASYNVTANVPGYVQQQDYTPITPLLAQPLAACDVVLDHPTAWVAGKVVDASGEPVRGAQVSVGSGAITDAHGNFRAGGVLPGTVMLEVTTKSGSGAYAELKTVTTNGIVILDAPVPASRQEWTPGLG